MYTKEMETVLAKAGVMNYAKAKELAAEFGKTPKSVVAKVKSMALPYEALPVKEKKVKEVTKAELVAQIAASLEVDVARLNGLDKATGSALANLIKFVTG